MAKITVLIADGMDKDSIASLKQKGFEVIDQHFEEKELSEKVKQVNAVVVRSATKIRKPILDAALETKQLSIVIRGGVGIDNIDAEYAREKGITVKNTPAASSASVAELAIGHMFCLARSLHHANLTMRQGKWEKKLYAGGFELAGKTLGIVGMGRIGNETAKRAMALGMRVIYIDIVDATLPGVAKVTKDELLAQSDFVSLHVPLDKKVGAFLKYDDLKKMKKGSYVVNCARGGVVDEEGLLQALDEGHLAGAALDVFAQEPTTNERLYHHDKISLTPHLGATTKEGQERVGKEVVEILCKHFKI